MKQCTTIIHVLDVSLISNYLTNFISFYKSKLCRHHKIVTKQVSTKLIWQIYILLRWRDAWSAQAWSCLFLALAFHMNNLPIKSCHPWIFNYACNADSYVWRLTWVDQPAANFLTALSVGSNSLIPIRRC